MLEILQPLAQYGAMGVILIALIIYMNSLVSTHKKERDEWRQQSERQFNQVVTIVKSNTEAVADLKSTILSIRIK